MREGTYLHLYVDVGHNDHGNLCSCVCEERHVKVLLREREKRRCCAYASVDHRLLDMAPSIARQHSTKHRPLQIGDVISRVPSDEQAAVNILPLTLILIPEDILAGSPRVGTDAAIWMVLQKRVQLLAEPH